MGNIGYKINNFFSRIKFKLKNNKKLHKILDNKILYVIMGILLILFLTALIYDLFEHRGTYKFIKKNFFRIKDIEIYYYVGLIITSIYISFISIIKYNILEKINKLFFVYIVYSIILYSITLIELKTKILSIITPLVVYYGYKIYLFIKEDKQKYKYSFLIDSRYFFLIALILLIYTPIYIYLEDKKMAENLSIYAYYFLVIGVVYEIVSSKFIK